MADQHNPGGNCNCGCCASVSQETPQSAGNRPGLAAISYRAGTYAQFQETLQARISLSGQPMLRDLRTRDSDDFTIALFDAFSVMADVLTFYTERNANEAYLRTATERLSVRELAALVGYRLSPGVAANAALAFNIDPASGAFGASLSVPLNSQVPLPQNPPITIPVGTQVQSVPGPGQTAQTFETVEAIEGRAAWNAISPRLWQPQTVVDDSTQDVGAFVLTGAIANLKPGDPILILKGDLMAAVTAIRTVKQVVVSADSKTSTVYLDGSAGTGGYNPSSEQDPPAAAMGSVSDITAADLIDATVQSILGFSWDADTLQLLAKMKKWPIDQLEAAINQNVTGRDNVSGGSVYVLRQQAACFGYNLPFLESPPFSPPPTYDPVDSKTINDWTPAGTVYLDTIYPQIAANSYVVLQANGDPSKTTFCVLRITRNQTVSHVEFNFAAKVSLLQTAPDPNSTFPDLTKFGLRHTSVLCQSEELPLAQVPITGVISGDKITLDRAYLSLRPGQSVLVTGQCVDLPGTTAAEIRTLQTVTLINGYTVIKLDELLDHSYYRASVKFNMNVAQSTDGATVTEVLGNGDATQAFQSFTLKQAPLTYTAAATSSGTASTLQVWVDGVLWSEVPFFYGHGPEEHIYITSQDESGTTTVIFGDGETGARLPTGVANIKATYRHGIGSGALVDANQISLLTSRPLGVRSATNPLASSDAADPESLDDARQNATLTIITLDRVVSLEDYESFARAFTGISKALAVWIWDGQQRIVLLTVAGVDGAIVDPAGTKGKALADALAAASEPGVTVKLASYDPIFFKIGGIVTVSPDRQPDEVRARIEAALRSTFTFAARGFGQAVHLSEVVATIQDVDGVVNVELDFLYYSTDTTDPHPRKEVLTADIPQTGAKSATQAQLLMLDAAPLSDLEVTQ